jgi:hydroxyacylglutathione hydrolase
MAMMKIKQFTFNPFFENTYLLYDETNECVIIDPGCSQIEEYNELKKFIEKEGLTPVRLLNTHSHIDHIFGNRFVADTYKLELEAHEKESDHIKNADSYAGMFGMPSPNTPAISKYINEGDAIVFGNTNLEVLFTPGHSPGHVVFYNPQQKVIIGGDVLFRESIGRTDLPGGDYNTLIQSIKNKLFVLEDDITVYPGHGMPTTIGYEKRYNPFLAEEVPFGQEAIS